MGKPPSGAEPRIELGPALQQADALPTEQRRTILLFLAKESLVSDISAGDGKIANLFYSA